MLQINTKSHKTIEFGNEENGTLILYTTTIWYQLSSITAHFKRSGQKGKNKRKMLKFSKIYRQ
jgi:hypothetical protein